MSPSRSAKLRRFLFLQGPHGPFFNALAGSLSAAGAECHRIGFNRGDAFFWRRANYIAFTLPQDQWPAFCGKVMDSKAITDLVLYGDSRAIHACAIALAKARGITVHVFEEGYLRPYWVTYERDGANGNSALMNMSVAEMRAALDRPAATHAKAPGHWGDMREHMFYGALYHFCVLALNGRYPNFLPHRGVTVGTEARLFLRRFALWPLHRVQRRLANWQVRRGNFPFHLVLLQLEHDSSFRDHSALTSMREFVDICLDGFVQGAASHHHLVFKAHPLEDGRVNLPRLIKKGAELRGIGDRVHFISGGKLAALVREARSAITVNSTAAQQALWHGLPVRIFGRAIYDKPEFVSHQPLPDFFAQPLQPDREAYRDFRQFLLETSQIPGGYYSRHGRRKLLRQVPDLMLASAAPYQIAMQPKSADGQHLRRIK